MSYFSLEFAVLFLVFFVIYWMLGVNFGEFFARVFGALNRIFGAVFGLLLGEKTCKKIHKKTILVKANIMGILDFVGKKFKLSSKKNVGLGEKKNGDFDEKNEDENSRNLDLNSPLNSNLNSRNFNALNSQNSSPLTLQNSAFKISKKGANLKDKKAINLQNKTILAKSNINQKGVENSLFELDENEQNELINSQKNSQNQSFQNQNSLLNLNLNSQENSQKNATKTKQKNAKNSQNFEQNLNQISQKNSQNSSQNLEQKSQENSRIPKAQNISILIFSYIVYTMINPHFALILFVYTFFIHYFALLILVRQKRAVFAFCIAFVLLNLCFFKYFTSIKDGFDALLIALGLGYLNADIIFPVGLSFYTFASITYLVSVYKDKKIETFVNLATYLSFFPTLLMGPIMRSKDFFAQLHQKRQFKNADLILTLLLFGIVKKVFIANYLGIYSKEILSNPAAFNALELLCGIYAFSVQIYCDFSGYVDLVSAFGLCLGFVLPINFNMPYLAKNLRDFWKRWHISLCEFIRDYIYIPLGGSKRGKMRVYFNLLFAFALSGLWHGNTLNFIIWGLLHGCGVVFLHFDFAKKINLSKVPFLSTFLTFHFVAFAWVFFYYTNFSDACEYFKALFSNAFAGVSYTDIYAFFGFGALFFSYPLFVNFKAHCERILSLTPLLLKPLLIAFFLLLIFAFMPSGVPAFIYEAF